MRYLIFILLTIALISCSKEEDCQQIDSFIYDGEMREARWNDNGINILDTLYNYSLQVSREADSLSFMRQFYSGTYYYPESDYNSEFEAYDNNYYGQVSFRLFDTDSIHYSTLQVSSSTSAAILYSFKGAAQP